MARISHIIKPVLLACLLGLTACVGPDEGGMASSSEAVTQTVSQGLTLDATFSLEGFELVSRDLRLLDLRFSHVEIVFTSLDGEHEDVVVPIDTMAFDEHGESTSEGVVVPLPATGRYSVRMQARTTSDSADEEDEDSCIGMCFDALVNPGSPVQHHLVDDSNDGPNPHPFDGGDDGGAPSEPGGEGDPVAEDSNDGPNPHPFDGGDDGGAPSEPGGEGDPVADEDTDSSEWSTLTFESDDSLRLEMGEIDVVGDDEEQGSSLVLCINLLDIEAAAESVVIEPATNTVAPEQVEPSEEMRHEDMMHAHEYTPISAERLIEDARHINNRGRYYY